MHVGALTLEAAVMSAKGSRLFVPILGKPPQADIFTLAESVTYYKSLVTREDMPRIEGECIRDVLCACGRSIA